MLALCAASFASPTYADPDCDQRPAPVLPPSVLPSAQSILEHIDRQAFITPPPAPPDRGLRVPVNIVVHELGEQRIEPKDFNQPGIATHQSLEPGSFYVVEVGSQDNARAPVVAYGRRIGEHGGEGKLSVGNVADISGSAAIGTGAVATKASVDLHLVRIPLGNSGAVMSAVSRAAFQIEAADGAGVKGQVSTGGGLVFSLPTGTKYPVRINIMGSPAFDLNSRDGKGPNVGGAVFTGAELVLF